MKIDTMSKFKRHKVKTEKPETSSSHSAAPQDYDLTYYIHDRVELMHQVFSVLKHKDLKAMAPECVRHISIDDLQELCTEELLGISSKRLCAILDGASPPSDTESSSESPERFETISLDSISSDEEILSESSSKKNKKHKRHHTKNKSKKRKKSKEPEAEECARADGEQSRAARAGLTVLELLELQARARAIRAQLQQDQAAKQDAAPEPAASSAHSSDNEVEIKEEPPEVVEISSEDEKPDVDLLRTEKSPQKDQSQDPGASVTKRINDLIITVPQSKQSRKIKLNRSKITVSVCNDKNTTSNADASTSSNTVISNEEPKRNGKVNDANKSKSNDAVSKSKNNDGKSKPIDNKNKSNDSKVRSKVNDKESQVTAKAKEKPKKKHKKNKKKTEEKDSDHDEITLQLSDTEKMDLLEDLDRKNFENVSSSGSEDSESSSSDSSDEASKKDTDKETTDNSSDEETKKKKKLKKDSEKSATKEKRKKSNEKLEDINKSSSCVKDVTTVDKDNVESNDVVNAPVESKENAPNEPSEVPASDEVSSPKPSEAESATETYKDNVTENNDVAKPSEDFDQPEPIDKDEQAVESQQNSESNKDVIIVSKEKSVEVVTIDDIPVLEEESSEKIDSLVKDATKDSQDTQAEINNEGVEKEMSEGELSDKTSSEVEAVELKPEVVCISDTEETDKGKKAEKKKKKKEKKSKSKKSKKSKSNFRESSDQNFFEESERIDITGEDTQDSVTKNGESSKITTVSYEETDNVDDKTINKSDAAIKCEENTITLDDDGDYDDVYEIFELSDDSSCYEVEGTVLSKEPTAEEIEALSAKIDEIEREDVVTEEEIREHERISEKDEENETEISWKDRYLDSSKVKRVLITSNIFNLLRKKNRELKKKLEESKKTEEPVEDNVAENEIAVEQNLEEGSIEHYNTLQGSSKYIDPPEDKTKELENNEEDKQHGETENSGELDQTKDTETPEMMKEMRKDAKQLLKMYKKLLKYNDIYKKKDPSKKKKKKNKKKNKETSVVNTA